MASYDDPILNAAIYSDFYYNASEKYTDSFRYRLESPLGNVLRRGEVSEKPDGTPALIYLNRICEPYLSIELDPTKTGLTSHPDASKKFWLFDDDTGTSACTYTPIRMYSGNAPCETGRGGHFVPGEKILSDPIKRLISKDMVMPFTVFTENQQNVPVYQGTARGEGGDFVPGGGTGDTCGYYLRLDRYNATIPATAQTVDFIVTDTNIPYYTFPNGQMIYWGPDYGVMACWWNREGLAVEYWGPEGLQHCIVDHTNEAIPKISYDIVPNYTGKVKTFKEEVYIKPPLCSNTSLLCTINITQLP